MVESHARFHADGEIVHGMVDHPVERTAAQHRVVRIEGWPPEKMIPLSTRDPRGGVLMPLANQVDQFVAVGGGMAHGTMVP